MIGDWLDPGAQLGPGFWFFFYVSDPCIVPRRPFSLCMALKAPRIHVVSWFTTEKYEEISWFSSYAALTGEKKAV